MAHASASSSRPVVFITGASSGIGAAAVSVFAAAGYDVVLAARRKEKLEHVAAETRTKNASALVVPVVCDVMSDDSVRSAFALVQERFGRLDALINNAGYGVYGSVEQTAIETFRANMETNFLGAIRCTQAALPLLRHAVQNPVCHGHVPLRARGDDGTGSQQLTEAARGTQRKRWGACIVMVSSFVGRRGLPLMSSYCATKFAMEALSESLRVELHDERIAVAVVNPGVTQTEFVTAASGTRPANYISPKGGMSAHAVAEVLLKSVRCPRRNRYLTAEGKAGIALQWLAPGLFDRGLLRAYRKATRKPR